MTYQKFIDISVLLGEESIDYPGDTPYQRKTVQSLLSGDDCNLSELTMSAHAGTHLDAPFHFVSNGKTIDQIPIERFICSAHVVEAKDETAVYTHKLNIPNIQKGDAILFKTQNSTSGRCANGIFDENFIYLSEEAARWCVKKKVGLVGLDYISVEAYSSKTSTVHRKLLENNILILEGLNLAKVPEGHYTLLCFPLKIKGGDGSPVRAVLAVS